MLRETTLDTKRYPGFWLIMMIFLSLLLAPTARSNDIETATKLMADGKFYEAAEMAAAVGDARGLTLAARALAIYGHEIAPENEKQELFIYKPIFLFGDNENEGSILIPNHINGYLQYVNPYQKTIIIYDNLYLCNC